MRSVLFLFSGGRFNWKGSHTGVTSAGLTLSTTQTHWFSSLKNGAGFSSASLGVLCFLQMSLSLPCLSFAGIATELDANYL